MVSTPIWVVMTSSVAVSSHRDTRCDSPRPVHHAVVSRVRTIAIAGVSIAGGVGPTYVRNSVPLSIDVSIPRFPVPITIPISTWRPLSLSFPISGHISALVALPLLVPVPVLISISIPGGVSIPVLVPVPLSVPIPIPIPVPVSVGVPFPHIASASLPHTGIGA
jgi:hypothetical protein